MCAMTRSTLFSRNHPTLFWLRREDRQMPPEVFYQNILQENTLKSYFEEHLRTVTSAETLRSDWLGLLSGELLSKPSWLSNIAKIPVAFKPEPSLNLTPTLYFEPRFPMFIINDYDRKTNACNPWTSCYFCCQNRNYITGPWKRNRKYAWKICNLLLSLL